MTLVYIVALWCAISFFLVGLWITYLEVSRWLLRRSARAAAIRERPDPAEQGFMRREMLP